MSNEKEKFISPLYDTTFKYLWKRATGRKWFTKLIKYITNIDLDEYQLYDPELNTGNSLKDYRLDILFVRDSNNPEKSDVLNVEVYKNYNADKDFLKSHAYVFHLLSSSMMKGEEYIEKHVVQVNFNDGYSKKDRDASIVYYKEIDSTGINEVDYFKIYDVFLSKFKGICYNEAEEMDAMLSLLTADSYEEMIRIANGNKEALDIVEELKDISYYVDYFGAYNVEEEQKRREKTARTFGYKEGVEEGIEEGKKAGIEEGKKVGIEEGRKEANIKTAKSLLKNKVDLEVISSSTELTIEELKELQKEIINE